MEGSRSRTANQYSVFVQIKPGAHSTVHSIDLVELQARTIVESKLLRAHVPDIVDDETVLLRIPKLE